MNINDPGLLLTTSYFPPVEYFSLTGNCSRVLVEKHENYNKQSYRNRCVIIAANGTLSLVIPVKRFRGKKTLISDIKPDYTYKWQRLHKISIESAYRSAPFYEYYIDDIMPFFETRYNYLLDLNSAIFEKMLGILKFDTPWEFTDKFNIYPPPGFADKRESIHPKIKNPEVLDITKNIRYTQVFESKWGFVPGPSILDLLFNTGPDSRQILLDAALKSSENNKTNGGQ
ncbi:MAG: WbqC family protein [Bacteroidales bacterium]